MGGFVTAFKNIERIAILEGFKDVANIRLTATTLLMFIYILGRIFGVYVTGGLLAGYFGFHVGILAVALLILTSWMAFCSTLFKLKLLDSTTRRLSSTTDVEI